MDSSVGYKDPLAQANATPLVASVNETAEKNGVTLTVQDVYNDGESLSFSYAITTDNPMFNDCPELFFEMEYLINVSIALAETSRNNVESISDGSNI